MMRIVTRYSALAIAALLIAAAAVYTIQKPYQQDRILISLRLKAAR